MSYSVIIPTHDRPELLARALRSVHAQTVPAAEIIIVDDASTPPLILPAELSTPRTRIISVKQAVGGAAARNLGLAQAACPVVAFLDDDDEWLPKKMEKQLLYFAEHPAAVLVSCGHFRAEAGHEYAEVFSEAFVRSYHQFDNFFGSFSFVAINRAAAGGDALLDPAMPALQDWEFALRLVRRAPSGVIEEPLVRYYAHDLPRITNRRLNQLRGLRRFYFKHRILLAPGARRWLLSRLIFERGRNAEERSRRRRTVFFSIRVGASVPLPLRVKVRALGRRLASLVADPRALAAWRSAAFAISQRVVCTGPIGENRSLLRVLMITGRADFGGGPEHVWQLSRALLPKADIFVACPHEEPYWNRYAATVTPARIQEIPHRRLSLRALWKLARFTRAQQIDVIHAHGRAAGIYGRLLALFTQRPCCYTPHGGTPVRSVKTFAQAAVEFFLSLWTSKIIAVSPSEAAALRPLAARRAQIQTVLNGVAIPDEPIIRTVEGSGVLRVLHVTRFVPQKNSELLLPILQSLAQRGELNRFQFRVLGEGPGRSGFETLLRQHGLAGQVEFAGAVSRPQAEFQRAFCLLSTSRWEGLPLVVLEAMALGLPVLATDVAGNRDAVVEGETGRLYEQSAPASAAQQLIELANDPQLWAKFSVAGRRRAETLFSVQSMAAATLGIYHEICHPQLAPPNLAVQPTVTT